MTAQLNGRWDASAFFENLCATNRLARHEGFTFCRVSLTADGKFIDITLSQAFNTYGLFVDYGTGSNTPRGNSGDIGRENKRKRKRWFSRKYFASVMNILEFYADSLGEEFCRAISNALNPDIMRRSIQ